MGSLEPMASAKVAARGHGQELRRERIGRLTLLASACTYIRRQTLAAWEAGGRQGVGGRRLMGAGA